MKVSKIQILALRREGWSYQKIANFFGINKGVAWRIANAPDGYAEKVGNKKDMKHRKVYPIWLAWESSDFLYRYLPRYIAKLARYCGIYYWWSLYDYILDYVYSKPPSYWNNINKPESYVRAFVKRLIQSRLTRLDSFNQILILGGTNGRK